MTFAKQSISASHAAREAKHLQQVQGEGVVPLQGINSDAGAPGLLLVEAACSLADVAYHQRTLPETEVRAVGAATAAALARVHQAGLVHGDVKPANLLLSHGGELWLADFDAAVLADGKPLQRHSPPRTSSGAPACFATDITALVVTLVELATGVLIDPATSWSAEDLRRLGCSDALSAELSMLLQRSAATDDGEVSQDAQHAAQMLAKGSGSLPAPVSKVHSADSTPTVEFTLTQTAMRAVPRTQTPTLAPNWWQRGVKSLAATFAPSRCSGA